MSKLLKFTELDVDGCGTDVEIQIRINQEEYPDDWKEKLARALEEIKYNFIKNDKCFDTDDIVKEALEAVFGKDVTYDIIMPEYEFEF